GPVVERERVGPGRPQDGAAAGWYAAPPGPPERPPVVLQRPPPAVPVTDELVPLHAHPFADDGTDHRVQPGTVPTSGQDADPHLGQPCAQCRLAGSGAAIGVTGKDADPKAWQSQVERSRTPPGAARASQRGQTLLGTGLSLRIDA